MGDLFGIGQLAQATNELGLGIAGLVQSGVARKENNELQQRLSEKSIDAAREFMYTQREWQKEDQKYQAQREDSAIQRRAADLKAAGINPLIAGGTGGEAGAQVASGGNSASAPPIPHTEAIDIGERIGQLGSSINTTVREAAKTIEDIKKLKEETRGTSLENDAKEIENRYRERILKTELTEKLLNNSNLRQTGREALQRYTYNANEEQRKRIRMRWEKEAGVIEGELKKAQKAYEEEMTTASAEERERLKEQWTWQKAQIINDGVAKFLTGAGILLGNIFGVRKK